MLKRILAFFRRQPAGPVITGAVVVTVLIGLADYATGAEISWSIFYLIPTAAVAWSLGLRGGVVLAVLGAVTWLLVNIAAGETYSSTWVGMWNAGVRFGFFFIVVLLLTTLRSELLREQELARTDPLTGAMNSRGFFEQLELEIRRSRRTGRPLSLAYLDVDDFKLVNDRLGHRRGDELLSAIVACCRETLRSSDFIGRVGGDEFAIALPETEAEAARLVMGRTNGALRLRMQQDGWPASFSIGVVTATAPHDGEVLVHEADQLMYEAKHRGKNSTLYGILPGPASLPSA